MITIIKRDIRSHVVNSDHPYKLLYKGPTNMSWGAYGLLLWISIHHSHENEVYINEIYHNTEAKNRDLGMYFNELANLGYIEYKEKQDC